VKQLYALPIADRPKDYSPIIVKIGSMKFDLRSGVLHYLELTLRKGFSKDWDDYCILILRDMSEMVTTVTDCSLEDIEEDMIIAGEMMDFIFCNISSQFQSGEA
jgi:hypothetical protein